MIQIRHFAPAQFGEPLLEIRIARNVPAYPASLKWLLGGFALMCLAVAGIFALHGAVPVLHRWPVLRFLSSVESSVVTVLVFSMCYAARTAKLLA